MFGRFRRFQRSTLKSTWLGTRPAKLGLATACRLKSIFSRDGGSSWERQKSGTNNNVSAVHFADARTGWTVGAQADDAAFREPRSIRLRFDGFDVAAKGLGESYA